MRLKATPPRRATQVRLRFGQLKGESIEARIDRAKFQFAYAYSTHTKETRCANFYVLHFTGYRNRIRRKLVRRIDGWWGRRTFDDPCRAVGSWAADLGSAGHCTTGHRNVRPSVRNETRSLSLTSALCVNSGTARTKRPPEGGLSAALQLPTTPMRVFARRIEHSLDIPVQRPHDADPRKHRRAAECHHQDQRLHGGLPLPSEAS
jgi:hypothetical protein